jgi:hypothetical protein
MALGCSRSLDSNGENLWGMKIEEDAEDKLVVNFSRGLSHSTLPCSMFSLWQHCSLAQTACVVALRCKMHFFAGGLTKTTKNPALSNWVAPFSS